MDYVVNDRVELLDGGRCNVIRAFAHNGARSSVGEETFGEGALPDPERRYARATEFVKVVNALFDANDPAAARRTAASSVSVDGAGRYSVAAWPWSAGPGRSAAKRAATGAAPAWPDRHRISRRRSTVESRTAAAVDSRGRRRAARRHGGTRRMPAEAPTFVH